MYVAFLRVFVALCEPLVFGLLFQNENRSVSVWDNQVSWTETDKYGTRTH